jgi:hypothetical protein
MRSLAKHNRPARSKRWRYYVSQAALQGDKSKAASILRVPAADVEKLVAEAVGKHSLSDASPADLRNLIDRVVISHATIRIQLSEVADGSDGARILTLPWTRPSPYRKREIIQGADDGKTYARPMPANARAILIDGLRDAHRWLDELLSDPRLTLESLASRESKTERSIRMTLSLAFLAPEIVKAAVEGRTCASPGAIIYACMDWRHMAEMLAAGDAAKFELLNLCVWVKTNGGMGSLYRSRHELVFVFRNGGEAHCNNVNSVGSAEIGPTSGTTPAPTFSSETGARAILTCIQRSNRSPWSPTRFWIQPISTTSSSIPFSAAVRPCSPRNAHSDDATASNSTPFTLIRSSHAGSA